MTDPWEQEAPGLITRMGLQLHSCIPANGQAKPIERSFRDLVDSIARHPLCDGAYTGTVGDKPADYGSKAVMLGAFIEMAEAQINEHNTRTGRTGGVCKGRSFAQVFEESYASRPIIPIVEEERAWWLLAGAPPRRLGENGEVTWDGRRYWGPELVNWAGEKIIVRYDPDRPSDPIHVYDEDGQFICVANEAPKAGFIDADAARTHNQARAAWVKQVKASGDKPLSPHEVADKLLSRKTTEPTIASRVVQMRPKKEKKSRSGSTRTNDPAPVVPMFSVTAEQQYANAQLLQAGLDRLRAQRLAAGGENDEW